MPNVKNRHNPMFPDSSTRHAVDDADDYSDNEDIKDLFKARVQKCNKCKQEFMSLTQRKKHKRNRTSIDNTESMISAKKMKFSDGKEDYMSQGEFSDENIMISQGFRGFPKTSLEFEAICATCDVLEQETAEKLKGLIFKKFEPIIEAHYNEPQSLTTAECSELERDDLAPSFTPSDNEWDENYNPKKAKRRQLKKQRKRLLPEPKKTNGKRYHYYSEDENRRMIQFLIQNNAICRAQGSKIWVQFLTDQTMDDPQPSAVALAGHFKNYLKTNYGKYTNDPSAISEFEKKLQFRPVKPELPADPKSKTVVKRKAKNSGIEGKPKKIRIEVPEICANHNEMGLSDTDEETLSESDDFDYEAAAQKIEAALRDYRPEAKESPAKKVKKSAVKTNRQPKIKSVKENKTMTKTTSMPAKRDRPAKKRSSTSMQDNKPSKSNLLLAAKMEGIPKTASMPAKRGRPAKKRSSTSMQDNNSSKSNLLPAAKIEESLKGCSTLIDEKTRQQSCSPPQIGNGIQNIRGMTDHKNPELPKAELHQEEKKLIVSETFCESIIENQPSLVSTSVVKKIPIINSFNAKQPPKSVMPASSCIETTLCSTDVGILRMKDADDKTSIHKGDSTGEQKAIESLGSSVDSVALESIEKQETSMNIREEDALPMSVNKDGEFLATTPPDETLTVPPIIKIPQEDNDENTDYSNINLPKIDTCPEGTKLEVDKEISDVPITIEQPVVCTPMNPPMPVTQEDPSSIKPAKKKQPPRIVFPAAFGIQTMPCLKNFKIPRLKKKDSDESIPKSSSQGNQGIHEKKANAEKILSKDSDFGVGQTNELPGGNSIDRELRDSETNETTAADVNLEKDELEKKPSKNDNELSEAETICEIRAINDYETDRSRNVDTANEISALKADVDISKTNQEEPDYLNSSESNESTFSKMADSISVLSASSSDTESVSHEKKDRRKPRGPYYKYTDEENIRIIEYLINNTTAGKVKGVRIWEKLLADNVLGNVCTTPVALYHHFRSNLQSLYQEYITNPVNAKRKGN